MTDNNADSPTVFLETTVQIERVIGTEHRRQTIRGNIQNRSATTSGHVLGEFNRTLVKDAVVFRDLLISSPTVEDALKRVPSYNRGYRRTMHLMLTLAWDDDKQNTIDRLEKFIEWQAYDHFFEPVTDDRFVDAIGCVLKDWKPELDAEGKYDLTGLKCLKQDPPDCNVQAFIEANRNAISAFVLDANGTTRHDIKRATTALADILSGADVPFGERSNCYPISDSLIVLECPRDCEMYSTDGDVAEICEHLDRACFQEASVG